MLVEGSGEDKAGLSWVQVDRILEVGLRNFEEDIVGVVLAVMERFHMVIKNNLQIVVARLPRKKISTLLLQMTWLSPKDQLQLC